MSVNRRALLKGMTAGAGGLLFAPYTWPRQIAAAEPPKQPLRLVFFLQNHGFSPTHATPEGVKVNDKTLDKVEDVPLSSLQLPKYIEPLTPHRDRLTIVHGLNGKHVVPYHSAPYGALGGFKKEHSSPRGETIDCALSRALPSVVPLLALGWESLTRMQGSSIYYASSAWGANKAVPMYCNPLLAYKNLFGVATAGKDRDDFQADTELYDFLQHDAAVMESRLPDSERGKFHPYLEGHIEAGQRRRRLLEMAAVLEKFAPLITDKFTQPKFESDWWEASLSVGIAALTSGVTNVLTISSGLCETGGTWFGLGAKTVGHTLGHTSQTENPDWLKIRRSNMEMLAQIISALEAVPEGEGTMMDNTLIIYTSCAAETQHSVGNRWPYLLLGNLGGKLRSGRYLQYPLEPSPLSRTINALYCTLLHVVGTPRDRFNLTGNLKHLDRPGPLSELLA